MDTASRSVCPHCPSSSTRIFSKRGLAIHIRRMHWPLPQPVPQQVPDDSQPLGLAASHSALAMDKLAGFKKNVKVLKHIPKGARCAVAGRLVTVIDRCLQTNLVDDWYCLLTFAFSALRVPESGGKESLTSKVKKNLDVPLSDASLSKNLRPSSLYKRIETKVYDGDLRGAVRLLTSDCSLAPADSSTLASLREKHPSPLRPASSLPTPDSSILCLTVSPADVLGALSSFHTASAAGMDGLRPQHLKELVSPTAGDNGQRLLDSLTRLCNFLLEGRLNIEVCPYLYGASLCALTKKDGGIRPIAVGGAIRRLVAKLGCRSVKEQMAATLQPHQLGFGTPLGCEAAIHATRTFVMNPVHAGDVVLKVDVKNAFNSVERDVMLSEVRDNIPSLYPFLCQCYVSPSHLCFDEHTIASQVGAQQGDPLGPLVFSLAINNIIKTLEAPLNLWYLDDGTIGGSPEVVARDMRTLIPKLRELGLTVNSDKCELFPCSDIALRGIAEIKELIPGIKLLDRKSLMLLGAPIFCNAVPDALQSKRVMLTQIKPHLQQLPAHVALTLFRSCFALPRMVYVMRTSPTWLYPEEVSLLDNDIRDVLGCILNVHLLDSQWQQASLPVRHGGLGVRGMRDTGVSAFLASSHGVVDLVTSILNLEGGNVDIPFADGALNAWSLLCPTSTCPDNPRVQRHWDDLVCKTLLARLLDSATGADVARLQATSRPESGAWLHALPSPHLGTFLDDSSLRVAVALRLGCQVCEPHQCKCGASVDIRAHHGLGCGKCDGRFPRHHMLNDIIRRALVSAGVPCSLEPPGLSRDDGKRPDGLTLVPWERGRSLVWDATCVSTFASTHLSRCTREAGAAAEWAATQKRRKYSGLAESYIFVPFAVEVTGAWCGEAKAFIREVGRRLRQNGTDPRSESYLVQHISLAIQRGNAASVMSTFPPGTTRGGLFD